MKSLLALVALLAPMVAAPASPGSLYEEDTYRALAGDLKAYRVGDVITVQVFETSSASTSTDTATRRTNNLTATVGIQHTGKQYGGSIGVAGNFDGGGSTQRTNRLLATVTVRVRHVLPGGDLLLEGEQVLTVNQEQQKVSVEGRVRPQDVSTENVVLSTRLADARITFVGRGDLSSRQKRSLWRKLLDWLGF